MTRSPNPVSEQIRQYRGKLNVGHILEWLLADGLIDETMKKGMYTGVLTRERAETHPFTIIAGNRWTAIKAPHPQLDLAFLLQWLSTHLGVPIMHIDPLKIDVVGVCNTLSHAYAVRYHILPVKVSPSAITIATAEPLDRDWHGMVQQALKRDIELVIADPRDIKRYLGEFYALARSVKGASVAHAAAATPGIATFEQLVELGKSGTLDANDRHVVNIVDWLLQYAFDQRASDIHLEPRRDLANVRFRIDGVMQQVYQVPTSVLNGMLSRLKLLGRMDIVEKRRPQDGRIKTKTPLGTEIELRLSTMPTAFGEKLVMRIFNPDVLVKSFEDLGVPQEDLQRWERLINLPYGIVLVTGPTGSGKTTTLYSSLKQLATPEVNLCTIEDPIEMVVAEFNQLQVQPQLGVDFVSGVRTLLRQDPDIIMIGEIRDPETAEMAIQAALTGHLVLSTLHTNDSPSAVTRLLELGMPSYLLQSVLLGVMAQRLVRTLCPHCKRPEPLDPAIWHELIAPWAAPAPSQHFRPSGCVECRMTGYLGRVGLYELLSVTDEIRHLIHANTDARAIRAQAAREGMKPLRIAGATKLAAGITSLEEVIKATPALGAPKPGG